MSYFSEEGKPPFERCKIARISEVYHWISAQIKYSIAIFYIFPLIQIINKSFAMCVHSLATFDHIHAQVRMHEMHLFCFM